MQWQKEKNRWTRCKKSLPGDHYGCQSTSYRLHYYLFSSYYNCKYKHKNYFSFESIFKIVKQKKKNAVQRSEQQLQNIDKQWDTLLISRQKKKKGSVILIMCNNNTAIACSLHICIHSSIVCLRSEWACFHFLLPFSSDWITHHMVKIWNLPAWPEISVEPQKRWDTMSCMY